MAITILNIHSISPLIQRCCICIKLTSILSSLSRSKQKYPLQSHIILFYYCCLLIIPLITALDTFIKYTHWLIRTPNLHLHKICFSKTTRRANRHGPIDIFPGICPSQYVIDFFASRIGFGNLRRGNMV